MGVSRVAHPRLQFAEQPLSAGAPLQVWVRLRDESGMQLAVDESLARPEMAAALAAAGLVSAIKLGTVGHIRRLEVDTSWFKGNFPESCSLEGSSALDVSVETLQDAAFGWKPALARTKLQAHTRHFFDEVMDARAITHVRFNIFPDGGVSRLRVYGTIE